MLKGRQTPESLTVDSLIPAFLSQAKPSLAASAVPVTAPLASSMFPVSAIVHEQHPRVNVWAGLSEAGQILAEAEAHKGASLTHADLRPLMEVHRDAYDPRWNFARRGISDEWMSGWEHAFMLADQQIARAGYAEPLSGIGSMTRDQVAPSYRGDHACAQGQTVRFRQAQLAVRDPEEFWQGVWEGQCVALDEQDLHKTLEQAWGGPEPRSLTAIRVYDDLLDLIAEAGNYGLEFVVGYVFGYAEGLLCGRIWSPARMEVPSPSGGSASKETCQQRVTGHQTAAKSS